MIILASCLLINQGRYPTPANMMESLYLLMLAYIKILHLPIKECINIDKYIETFLSDEIDPHHPLGPGVVWLLLQLRRHLIFSVKETRT